MISHLLTMCGLFVCQDSGGKIPLTLNALIVACVKDMLEYQHQETSEKREHLTQHLAVDERMTVDGCQVN